MKDQETMEEGIREAFNRFRTFCICPINDSVDFAGRERYDMFGLKRANCGEDKPREEGYPKRKEINLKLMALDEKRFY